MKPVLKGPESNRSKLEHEKTLPNFAFNFTLRRYTKQTRNLPCTLHFQHPTAFIYYRQTSMKW